jgi:hypothetical protein
VIIARCNSSSSTRVHTCTRQHPELRSGRA